MQHRLDMRMGRASLWCPWMFWMRHRQKATGSLHTPAAITHVLGASPAVGKKLGVSLLLLFFACWAWAPTRAAARAGINVALHAQSNYAMHGWVAGSEITTRGLQRAFEALDRVQNCQVFAPFSYDGLSSRRWDLVVIEGYTGTVPAFIHEVRTANERVVVLFFCLDTYPSLSVVGNLDVDAFLTNSRALLPSLRQIAPASSLLHLAADPAVMLKGPVNPRYEDNVVYLGQFKNTKHRLVETLKEVAPMGLSIYGIGWDNVEELLPFWRGVLPVGDIATLYTSAKVVLSTTESLQRSLGMVNNRVFEALSCGAAVVSDVFPAMEETFGDHVLYYRQPGDAARAVKHLLGNDTARRELGRKGRELVSSNHTYASRVPTILATMEEVLLSISQASSPAEATEPVPADTVVEALPGGVGAAAGVAAYEDDSAGIATATAGAQPDRTAASSLPERSPTDSSSAVTANGTTAATTNVAGSVPQTTTCRQPPEAVPTASEKQSAANHHTDGFPPMPRPRTALAKPAEHRLDCREDIAASGSGDNLDGGASPSSNADTLRLSTSGKRFSGTQFSTGVLRPNAPMVLVVYRSDFPPPGGWRRSVEAAAVTVAGGARITFLEIGEISSDMSIADYHATGQGSKEEEVYRRRVLEARLARLIPGEYAGHHGTSGVGALGEAAATEALGFMEWCCSVGLIAVYAKVGDPLERQFLHHLAAEGASRTVRTAFFAAGSLPSAKADESVPYIDQAPKPRYLSRYEWVEQCNQRQESPRRELLAAVATPEDALSGSPSDGCGRHIPRLRTETEEALFGISRHASISVLEPSEGTLIAARRNVQESDSDWAQLDLRVKVDHPFFRAPADGSWCVLLDGVEIGCRGDDDGDSAMSTSSLNMTVEVDPRALPRHAELEATIRGGALEAAAVVTRSAPVSVSIWAAQSVNSVDG